MGVFESTEKKATAENYLYLSTFHSASFSCCHLLLILCMHTAPLSPVNFFI